MEHIERQENLKDIVRLALEEALNKKAETKVTLTIAEAAKKTGIGRCKLEELIHSNSDFPYFRVGKKVLINSELLKEWLDKISNENRVL